MIHGIILDYNAEDIHLSTSPTEFIVPLTDGINQVDIINIPVYVYVFHQTILNECVIVFIFASV